MTAATPLPAREAPTDPLKHRADWRSGAVVLTLLLVAAATHGPVFGGASGYLAAGGGVLLGGLLGAAGARWRWNGFEMLLATVVSYLLGGGPLALPTTTTARVVPTFATVQGLVVGAVQAWKDLLTVTPPAGAFTGPAIVPYAAGILCSVAALTIALRTRRQGWALLPVAALALIGILWGSQSAPFALPAAATGTVLAVAWTSGLARRRRSEAGTGIVGDNPVESRRHRRSTAVGAVSMLLVCAAVSALGAPALNGDAHRYVLRDYVVPPIDLREYPSPLTSFRYWVDNQKDTTLFTVEGLKEGQRIRLATLDTYDGNVMRVGTESPDAGFRHTGSTVTDTPLPDGARTTTLEVTIGDYSGYWLPGGGDLRAVSFTSANAEDLASSLYVSSTLSSAITTRRLASGDSYSVTLVDVPTWTDDQLGDKSFAQVPMQPDTEVPEVVSSRLPEFLGDASTPVEKVRNMANTFTAQGFYSDGTDGMSRSGHRNSRIGLLLDPDQPMIGDDEQYAVAMALMARQAGYPARVVLGFYPEAYTEGPLDVTGTMAHAWVEVNFSGVGWVAFDTTPPRDQTPQTEVPKPKPDPRPQVLQPPIPPQEPADLTPEVDEENDEDSETDRPWLAWLVLGAKIMGGLLLVASPVLVILALKLRRRLARRRRGPDLSRLTGSWDELIDRATDLGTDVPRLGTRWEQARYIEKALHGTPLPPGPVFRPAPGSGSVGALAVMVDSGVFGTAEPDPDSVDRAWKGTDAALRSLTSRAGRRRRLLSHISIASLRARRRERLSTRRLRLPQLRQMRRRTVRQGGTTR